MSTADSYNQLSYAKCVEVSRRIRWDIDRDVIRGRELDFGKKFLPDSVSRISELDFLTLKEKVRLSQIQGRTYANMFGLVERFITAHTLKLANAYWTGDQHALQALVGFGDEEIKHQELFLRLEKMLAGKMPEGYRFVADTNQIADKVLSTSPWAILALTSLIEHFTQSHYRESLAPDTDLSELFKDVFLYHWREESQHTVIDELEWRKIDAQLSLQQRNDAITEFIELLADMDDILIHQVTADADYFFSILDRELTQQKQEALRDTLIEAYRWLFIDSGIEQQRFSDLLHGFISAEQQNRIRLAILDTRKEILS